MTPNGMIGILAGQVRHTMKVLTFARVFPTMNFVRTRFTAQLVLVTFLMGVWSMIRMDHGLQLEITSTTLFN